MERLKYDHLAQHKQAYYGRLLGWSSVDHHCAHYHSRQEPEPHYWLQAGMPSYEFGYWRADPVIDVYQSLSQRVRQQVFISELTENLYFLSHWRAVGCGGNEATLLVGGRWRWRWMNAQRRQRE